MPNDLLKKTLSFKTKSVDEENFIIRGVFSTADTDRHDEIVDQSGWDLKDYMLNPVILFAHDHYQPAIGKMINLSIENGRLEGDIKFAADEYDFAKTIFKLYAGGFMRAFSAGFMNTKYEVDEENDTIILRENKLFEVSCVNVPANAMALAKSKGIDVSVFEKRDEKVERAMDEKAALEVFTKDQKTKARAIKALTDALQVLNESDKAKAEEGPKGRKPHRKAGGKNKISVKVFNRAVRALLDAKKIK